MIRNRIISVYRLVSVTIFCGILAISSVSFAEKRSVVSINPVGIALFGAQNVEFEKVIDRTSGLAFYWADSGVTPAEINDVRFLGTEQRFTYRYYWTENAPGGGWGGISLAYSSGDAWKVSSSGAITDYVYDISAIALSIETGYRWFGGYGFNIAPIVMYRFILTDDLLGTQKTSLKEVETPMAGIGIGLNLGYAW